MVLRLEDLDPERAAEIAESQPDRIPVEERLLARMLKDLESTLVDRLRQRAQYELPILIDDILKEQASSGPDETDEEA